MPRRWNSWHDTSPQRDAVIKGRQVPQRRSHEAVACSQQDQVQGTVVQSEGEITASDRERRHVLRRGYGKVSGSCNVPVE